MASRRGMAVDSPSDIGVVKVAPRSIMKRIRMRVEKFSVHLKRSARTPSVAVPTFPTRNRLAMWLRSALYSSKRDQRRRQPEIRSHGEGHCQTAQRLRRTRPVDLCGARASVVDGPCRSLWSIVLRDAGLPPNWSWRAAVATRGNARAGGALPQSEAMVQDDCSAK